VWCIKRLAEDFDGLWLSPPLGTVDATGGTLQLNCHGAAPGNTVFFFRGDQPGTFPMPGCGGLLGQLLDWQTLGSALAGANGVASLSTPVAGSQFGTRDYFHAVDFTGCEMSNLILHTYQ
jgi:hypothetical protein